MSQADISPMTIRTDSSLGFKCLTHRFLLLNRSPLPWPLPGRPLPPPTYTDGTLNTTSVLQGVNSDEFINDIYDGTSCTDLCTFCANLTARMICWV